MKTSVGEFRSSMKVIFDAVRRGEKITVYSHRDAIAEIIPIKSKKAHVEAEEVGFGMWQDYDDAKEVAAFARNLRRGRKHDV